jgi:hypothetical protein
MCDAIWHIAVAHEHHALVMDFCANYFTGQLQA